MRDFYKDKYRLKGKTYTYVVCAIIIVISCSSAFSKSREYYKETIISGIFNCDTKCKEHKFHYKVQDFTYRMMQVILLKISQEIDTKMKNNL